MLRQKEKRIGRWLRLNQRPNDFRDKVSLEFVLGVPRLLLLLRDAGGSMFSEEDGDGIRI